MYQSLLEDDAEFEGFDIANGWVYSLSSTVDTSGFLLEAYSSKWYLI